MNYNNEKLEDALKRAKSGDQSAFSYLYEAYYQHAYIAAHDIITDFGECEDIVQDAFTRCFLKIQDGEEINGFGSYIQTTAKNIAKDHIKAREAAKRPNEVLTSYSGNDFAETDEERQLYDAERSEIQDALIKAADFYQTPEEHFEEAEIRDIVQSILDELPDYQRESLSLFYLEGMKYREISEMYGVSVDTVKSRVNQGKKKVEKKVLELEKTKGIKLRGLAPFVFFFVVLRQSATAKAAELSTAELTASGFQAVAGKVAAANPAANSVAANQTAAAGSKNASLEAIKSATHKMMAKSFTVAGKTITGKTVAIIAAGTIATGAVSGAVYHGISNDWDEKMDMVTAVYGDCLDDALLEDLGLLDGSDAIDSQSSGDTVTESEPLTEDATNGTTDAAGGSSQSAAGGSSQEAESDAAEDANIPGETLADGWYYTNLYEDSMGVGTSDMYVQDDYLVMNASFNHSETDKASSYSSSDKVEAGVYHVSLDGTQVYGVANSEEGIYESEDLQEFKDKAQSVYSKSGLCFVIHVTNGNADEIYIES